jgi:hypothetical protein
MFLEALKGLNMNSPGCNPGMEKFIFNSPEGAEYQN